jgi:hypothetical protein
VKRTPLKARPKPSTTDTDAARAWWVAVVKGKRCVVCKSRYLLQGHHVVSQQRLKKEYPKGAPDGRSLQELLWSVENGIPVCAFHHMRHESAFERIPARLIPLAAFKFAADLKLDHLVGPNIYPR